MATKMWDSHQRDQRDVERKDSEVLNYDENDEKEQLTKKSGVCHHEIASAALSFILHAPLPHFSNEHEH